mmetsp:Transcript_83412/g.102205  ORF Transcript_83412/g.102205 Transcript_83412/m.102205 type:complete len:228 (-) Transcript_83412:81-764(-)
MQKAIPGEVRNPRFGHQILHFTDSIRVGKNVNTILGGPIERKGHRHINYEFKSGVILRFLRITGGCRRRMRHGVPGPTRARARLRQDRMGRDVTHCSSHSSRHGFPLHSPVPQQPCSETDQQNHRGHSCCQGSHRQLGNLTLHGRKCRSHSEFHWKTRTVRTCQVPIPTFEGQLARMTLGALQFPLCVVLQITRKLYLQAGYVRKGLITSFVTTTFGQDHALLTRQI